MNRYDFNTRVDRSGAGSLKAFFTPQAVSDAGLVSYWGAEFEFATCPAFSQGVRECADRGLYGFTLQTGDYNARVKWWMENVRGFSIETDWIVPAQGTIFALATALRLFAVPDRQLIMINPGYSRYKQAADRLGLNTVMSEMRYENGAYSIDFEDLEAKMADPKAGLLAFSNPNNPTGLCLDAQTLEKIGMLSEKYGVPVFSDEIFAEVARGGARVASYACVTHGKSLALTCTSLGKCMSLTGVNHANLIIPDETLRARYTNQRNTDHFGSIDPMLYHGLMRAYTPDGADFIRALNEVIDANVSAFESTLPALIPGAKVIHPQGTFVIWVDYQNCGMDEDALAAFLNEQCLFMGDAGDDYAESRYFYRYNLAVPPKDLQNSFDRIRRAAHAQIPNAKESRI